MKSVKKLKSLKNIGKRQKSESRNATNEVSDPKLKKILDDRVMKNVPYPATNRLTISEIFDENDKPRIDFIRDHLCKEGRLTEDAALRILSKAEALFQNEPNLLYITPPITIVGDVHGQYFDLLTAIDLGGTPKKDKYLFLGDYVDRGYFSTEILIYLFSCKIFNPYAIFLLRGNHECHHLTKYFTFKKECLVKYSSNFYYAALRTFNKLPLAAVVNNQFLCVHGGITHQLTSLHDIESINRFQEIPSEGVMCDLLWSDPHPEFNENYDGEALKNRGRGCSYFYTFNVMTEFLTNNNLLSLIRAHEVQEKGYRLYQTTGTTFPTVISIFSAPNYLGIYNNKASVMTYQDNTLNARLFNSKEQPYWLPDFLDVFTWSLPFIIEKVTEMLIAICNIAIESDDLEKSKHECIRTKLRSICKVAGMYSKIRRESELSVKVKAIAPNEVSPLSTLIDPTLERRSSFPEGAERLLGTGRRLSFEEVKELDRENESLPRENISTKNSLKSVSTIENSVKPNNDDSTKKRSSSCNLSEKKSTKKI